MPAPVTLTSFDPGGEHALAAPAPRLPAAPAKIAESVAAWDALPFGVQRFMDGPNFLMPWGLGGALGATGTVSDRKSGRDLPLFWSEQDLRNFRVLSRHLCDTNVFAKGFLGLLTDFHIRAGFGWQACLRGTSKGAYDTGTAAADPSVGRAQWVLDRWRDGERGNLNSPWAIRSREGFTRWRRDGETFLRFFRGGRGQLPRLRFVEPAQVGSPDGSSNGPASFGVLTHPADVETVLAVYVRDPDGTGQEGRWVTVGPHVDADWLYDEFGVDAVPGVILHIKANVDSDVKRGLPDFFPVQEQLEGVRDLLRGMLTSGTAMAKIPWVEQYATATEAQVRNLIEQGRTYQQPNPAAFGGWGGAGANSLYSDVTHYQSGTVRHVDGGRNLLPGPTMGGAANLIAVEQAVLRGVGVLWRFPEYFSGDASNGNFASLKESGSPFVAAVEGGQLEWGAVERACAVTVLELAADAGVETPDGVFTRADLLRVDVETQPPKVVLTDREQDARISDMKLKNGTLSKVEAIQIDGRDPKHTFANIKAETPAAPPPGVQVPGPVPAVEGRVREDAGGKVLVAVTDKNGNQVHRWVHPADLHTHPTADAPAPAPAAAPTPGTPPDLPTLLGRLKAVGSAAFNNKVGRFVKAAEHKLAWVAHKTREVAVEAARRRVPPLVEAALKRLERALFVADFVGGYVSGGVIAATVNPYLGKFAATSLPSASILYVAYATVRDPAGVWAAAWQVVRDTLAGKAHESAPAGGFDLAAALADLLADDATADWREAVFLAALAADPEHPGRAVAVAAGAGAMPETLPPPTEADFGGAGDGTEDDTSP
jgi:hypothetical protein